MWRGKLPSIGQFNSAWTETGPDVVWGCLCHPAAQRRQFKEAERQLAHGFPQWSALSGSAEWQLKGLFYLSSLMSQAERKRRPGLRGELVMVNIWCLFSQGWGFLRSSKSLPRTAWDRACVQQQLRRRAFPGGIHPEPQSPGNTHKDHSAVPTSHQALLTTPCSQSTRGGDAGKVGHLEV